MRIIDCLERNGKPAYIAECKRVDLPQFFIDMGYKTGAEIGVYKAGFTEKFCRAGLRMYAVDGWCAYDEYNEPGRNFQRRQDFLYGHTCRVLAPYAGNVTIVRKLSMDAVGDFEDGSLDFVYIDGNHTLKYVIEDIYEWEKKVRKGGVVAGHDYAETNIIKVKIGVQAYTRAYGIKNWYVLGNEERGEKFNSWFWIK
jgi:hypothetical protein